MTRRILLLAAAACFAAFPNSIQAQRINQGVTGPVIPRNVISIAPIALILGQVFAPEYERVISPEASFAIAAGYLDTDFDEDFDLDDADENATYLRLEAKYRYYPSQVLDGILVGANVGLSTVDGQVREGGTERDFNATGPSVGFELGYARLYGASQRLYVGGIVGAKRIFWDVPGDVLTAYPTVRVAIGYAF